MHVDRPKCYCGYHSGDALHTVKVVSVVTKYALIGEGVLMKNIL